MRTISRQREITMCVGKQPFSSRWSSSRSHLKTVTLLALSCLPACTLAQDQRVSQYAHRAWSVRDGFFSGAAQAIAQSADGYIWIGTDSGLFRFDGSHFEPWTSPDGKKLPSNQILALVGARDGSLWIGMQGGSRTLQIASCLSIPMFMTTWAACSRTSRRTSRK